MSRERIAKDTDRNNDIHAATTYLEKRARRALRDWVKGSTRTEKASLEQIHLFP